MQQRLFLQVRSSGDGWSPAIVLFTTIMALTAFAAPCAAQADMLFENPIDGYALVNSQVYPFGPTSESADDFTLAGTIERVWIYGGNCCLSGCSFPTDIIEVAIRFYADAEGQPGDLLAEYILSGDDPAFIWNEAAGPMLLDVTLPQPFEADGTYFVSAQPEFDSFFCWGWWTSHNNNPIGSALWTRADGGAWQPYQGGLGPLNADLAFALIGTPAIADPPPDFVDDGCDSQWQEIDIPDLQPGEAGIPPLVEGVSNRLEDVVILSPTQAWAVGAYGYSELGPDGGGQSFALTLYFDGTDWTPVPAPSPPNVLGQSQVQVEAVAAVSADLIYAAGTYATQVPSGPDTFVMRWDGAGWEHIISPGQSGFGATGFLFEAVEAIDAENIWFGGQFNDAPGAGHPLATMVHYDGSNFTKYSLPIDPNITTGAHRIRAISALAADDIWAAASAGGIAVAVGASYVAHWDGSSWEHVPTPHPGIDEIARDILALAPDDVWICGSYDVIPQGGGPVIPTPLFLHWDGQQWEQFESPAFASSLVAISPNRIYGVNGETLVYWDGTQWGLVGDLDDDLAYINLRALAAFDDCDLLAVGSTSGSFMDTRAARYLSSPMHPGDIDGDGLVDLDDYAMLLECLNGPAFGVTPECVDADINGDGTVDVMDVALFLSSFSGS